MIIRKSLLSALCCIVVSLSSAQFDPLTNPLVLQTPEMGKVIVQKAITFHTINKDTTLKFDIYSPQSDKRTKLPVVIFVNGVGEMQIPEWQIYQDWCRLVAANGMIGIIHQSLPGRTDKNLDDLLTYLKQEADALQIDKEKMGIWVCSANTPTGWSAANDPKNDYIKAAVIYYGVTRPQDRIVRRKNVELLLVRAGLDGQNINAGMEELMANALRTDAHVEMINYPTGQHAFDGVDRTPRSREIILQTIDFFKRNLLSDNKDAHSSLLTNRQIWNLVLNENKTDEAIAGYRVAHEAYRNMQGQVSFFNVLLNENNLNGLGYQLLQANRVDDAIKIFTVNKETFPNSPNAYDAMSDAYERKGDTAYTVLYARMALDKLSTATNLPPQFARGIRESAERKITDIRRGKPHQRAHHELVYDESKKAILLISGSTPLNGGQSFRFFNDIWIYKDSKWKQSGTAGNERSGIRVAYDTKRNRLFSYGGFIGNSSVGELRVLEGSNWRVLSNLPEMVAAEGGLVYDAARDKLIAFGGSARMGQYHATTWEWDGYSWQDLKISGPPGRMAHAMVYDAKRNKTIVFGGMGDGNKRLKDTWEFDGKQWTLVDTTGPEARVSPGYAYDSKRGQFIIFGGSGATGSLSDTWAWNAKKWTKLSETGPAPRSMGYLAYDKNRDRIVLFGGRLGWPNDTNDTWEWDGKVWVEVR